ncbi:MAG: hypothetical protein LBF50_05400 [Azoarcus sp.]|nr:hypothetical protein [Azoarcus sp.]
MEPLTAPATAPKGRKARVGSSCRAMSVCAAMGNVATETDSEGHTLARQYDAFNRKTKITYPDGATTWERDLQGRIVAKVTPDGVKTAYEYDNDNAGRPASRTDALGQTRSFTYAADDRVTGIAYGNAIHPTPEVGYTWDADYPRITGIIDPTGSYNWTHDAGNKIAQAPYKFDANGNQTEDEKHTYKWDAENRLIWIGYKTNPQKSTEFKYDGQGRRVAIIEKAGATTKETCCTWCGDTICHARDGNDQPITYYFDEGTFRPEANTSVSKLQGGREYYARDHLGSVRDVLDQQSDVTASYDYDPYGKLTNSSAKQPEFGLEEVLELANSGNKDAQKHGNC